MQENKKQFFNVLIKIRIMLTVDKNKIIKNIYERCLNLYQNLEKDKC